jgi:hypothetical protein
MPARLSMAGLILAAVLATAPACARPPKPARSEPLICNVGLTAGAIPRPAGTTVDLGAVIETCNNPAGYRVWIDHTPGLKSVAVIVDGQRIRLSPTGATAISCSKIGARHTRRILLDLGDEAQSLKYFALRIEPISLQPLFDTSPQLNAKAK